MFTCAQQIAEVIRRQRFVEGVKFRVMLVATHFAKWGDGFRWDSTGDLGIQEIHHYTLQKGINEDPNIKGVVIFQDREAT